VYVPKQYVRSNGRKHSSSVPTVLIKSLFTALDNLIAQHRVPVMIG
jgi:hypothetical protein